MYKQETLWNFENFSILIFKIADFCFIILELIFNVLLKAHPHHSSSHRFDEVLRQLQQLAFSQSSYKYCYIYI